MKSERGNIIVYLLVGVVLFGLLLGGLWWVKARVADTPAAPVATTGEQDKSTTETEVNQDGTEQQPTEEAATGTENTPTTSAPTSPAPAPATPAPSTTTPAPSTPAPLPPESQTPNTGPSPNGVAASGPVENAIGTSLGLGVLAYLGTSYVRSRRATH
jgi:cytoskeletal protein RodZ